MLYIKNAPAVPVKELQRRNFYPWYHSVCLRKTSGRLVLSINSFSDNVERTSPLTTVSAGGSWVMSYVGICRFTPANGSLKDGSTDDVSHSLLVCFRLFT